MRASRRFSRLPALSSNQRGRLLGLAHCDQNCTYLHVIVKRLCKLWERVHMSAYKVVVLCMGVLCVTQEPLASDSLRTKSQKQRPVCLDVASYQELLAQEVRTRYAFSLTSRFISVILRAGAKGRRERGCLIEEAQTSLPSGIAGYGHHRGAAAGEHRPQLLSSAKAG